VIPDEAVEAAYAHLGPDDTGFRYVNKARLRGLLEAAAPFIAAQAWDEGFKQGGPMHDENMDDPDAHTRNPYRSGT
jgi:hypothetical protein